MILKKNINFLFISYDTKTNYESNSDGTSFLWACRKCFFLKMYMPLKITYLDLRFRCAAYFLQPDLQFLNVKLTF